jgi:hypothetical protein
MVCFDERMRPMRRACLFLTISLVVATGACGKEYPCPEDETEETMTGDANIAGVHSDSPSGSLSLSDQESDHDDVLDFAVENAGGDVIAILRRPASPGTYRFEDLVIEQQACPGGFGPRSLPEIDCLANDNDGGMAQPVPLAMTGTVDMVDDQVDVAPCPNNACGWSLKVDLKLQNVTPAITIDVEAVNSHQETQHTCEDSPLIPNTQ